MPINSGAPLKYRRAPLGTVTVERDNAIGFITYGGGTGDDIVARTVPARRSESSRAGRTKNGACS
jgi:hypothetical protein